MSRRVDWPWQRGAIALALAGLAAAVPLTATPAADAKGKRAPRAVRCESRPKVVAANSTVTVYEKGSPERYYACRRGSTRGGVKLGANESVDDSIGGVVVAGRLAMLARVSCPRSGASGCDGTIRIVDAVSRRVRATWTGFAPNSVGVGSLVLTAGGGAAWLETVATQQAPGPGDQESRILHVMSRAGTVTTVDTGNDIVPGSLAVGQTYIGAPPRQQNVLYWLKGEAARSVPLQ